MFHKIFKAADKVVGFEPAKAHCDIPCGIYDPHQALIGALTVIRMIDLMDEMEKAGQKDSKDYLHSMARYTRVKEEHAEIVKHEVRVIWGDYFKQNHLDKYPDVHEQVYKIMQLASKARQSADRDAGMQLLSAVNRFAEIFWETKGKSTKRVTSPYAPNEEMVVPVL